MSELDKTDRDILAALRHDARAALSDIAHRVGVSRATVRARIERLQSRGDIVGFTVLTRDDVARDPVRGLMMVGIEGRGAERIIRQLTGMAEVRQVGSTNGRWDVIAEIGAPTLEAFDAVLSRVRKLDGVAVSEASLLLSTRKAG